MATVLDYIEMNFAIYQYRKTGEPVELKTDLRNAIIYATLLYTIVAYWLHRVRNLFRRTLALSPPGLGHGWLG